MTETNTTPRTDLDKFYTERNAATAMRDDLFFLVGWLSVDEPETSKRLEAILTQHAENREQSYM
tara:strand:- start:654 stop:845 length:192 start_codon:yes stop_codon:yes gene_type:complete